ncbi:MAG: ABC transporter permease [Anaerorhabdus sp.]|uniref:ABC transporter permease n=1 Tax=Anaerorhabdus sp. TaxID=1872524 RepID=UPI002B21B855|nr:ABC transporter permease [Anaerorhabdus sp.]MEA4875095.1 ABC transporter permease [Anaerorhabdus sp.]
MIKKNHNSIKNIEKKFSIYRILLAILISLAIALALIMLVSKNPMKDFMTLLIGPLQNKNGLTSVVSKSIPLLFTGVAICLVNKCGQINIAAEGAFFSGAVAATAIAILPGIPGPIHSILCVLLAGLVGALVMGLPGYFHVKFNAVTIVTSLMINYVALYLGLYLILNPLYDSTAGFEASYLFQSSSKLLTLFGNSRIHIGLLVGLLVVGFGWFLLFRTSFGTQVRSIGQNPNYALYSGMPVKKTIIAISAIAGSIAGIGGAFEVLGNYQRFVYTGFTNHGWDGVMLAVMCYNRPQLIPFAAIFLAYIRTSADTLNFTSSIPPEIVSIIQGVIIIFVAAERFLSNWEHKAIVSNSKKNLEN